MTKMKKAVQLWHQYTETKDPQFLEQLLADDATFYSPVVHTPQEGKWICTAYLMAALMLFGDEKHKFTYVSETFGEQNAILEFSALIDGIIINGVDMLTINDEGKVDSFKVMLRPLKAVNLVHQKMGEMLKKMQS